MVHAPLYEHSARKVRECAVGVPQFTVFGNDSRVQRAFQRRNHRLRTHDGVCLHQHFRHALQTRHRARPALLRQGRQAASLRRDAAGRKSCGTLLIYILLPTQFQKHEIRLAYRQGGLSANLQFCGVE